VLVLLTPDGSENITIPQFEYQNSPVQPRTQSNDNIVRKGGGAVDVVKSELSTASIGEGRRLYVGNLAYAVREEDLWKFFHEFSV